MEKKYGEFSMEDVQKLTQSPTGQQLIAMLNTRSAEMNSALDSAKRDDLESAKRALASFISEPSTQALLKKLQEERHG